MEAWLKAKDSAFATLVGLGKFYTEEWRFTHDKLVREWLANLPASCRNSQHRHT